MMCSLTLQLLGKQLGTSIIQFLFVLFMFYHTAEACAAEASEQGESTDTLILCRACGHELAFGADIRFVHSHLALSSRNMSVGSQRIHIQLFENPHGNQFEVITFKRADVTRHWPADSHFSWFPGFSWTIGTCPRCKTHVGWAFQPSDWPDMITENPFKESEKTFFALITDRILKEDFASSLLLSPKSFTK